MHHSNFPLQPGTLLVGKYRVERTLGKGGMGQVVEATHLELGERCAIKVMLSDPRADPSAEERFLREARAAFRLKSPHAVKILDVDRLDDGAPYIVLEYLEGKDLKTVLRERGILPVHEAVRYILQAC